MDRDKIITQVAAYVKDSLMDAEGGHDWWHIYRVWTTAKKIADEEKVDKLVVELAALLHDIADPKFHNGDEDIGPTKATGIMSSFSVASPVIEHVAKIIRFMSYKASLGTISFTSREMEVVQDADRLDAIGAIGIARAFSYGGFKGRELYNPEVAPRAHMSKEEYKNSSSPTINHFYEKLLLLKEKMNTATGRRLAGERHQFMELYLEQFYAEWDGRK